MEDRTAELTDRTVNLATILAAQTRAADPLGGADATDGHVLIRPAQAVNRAWAEPTLASGTVRALHTGGIDG